MKILAEFELEITTSDTATNLEEEVNKFLRNTRKVPFGMLTSALRLTHVRKIDPWEESIPRF